MTAPLPKQASSSATRAREHSTPVPSKERASWLCPKAKFTGELPFVVPLLLLVALLPWQLSVEDLWHDEIYSLATARLGWRELLAAVGADVHPPLYYLLLKLSLALPLSDALALRLPSVLATIALVGLSREPILRALGRTTAIGFAWLVTFTPVVVSFSREGRMYTLAACLVTACASYALAALKQGRRRDTALATLLGIAAGYTHYYAALTVGLFALVLLVQASARQRRVLVGAGLITLMALSPWAQFVVAQVRMVKAGFWIPPTSLDTLQKTLHLPFRLKFEDSPVHWSLHLAEAVAWLLLLWGLFGGAPAHRRAQRSCVAAWCLTLVVALALSRFVAPVLVARYLFPAIGLFLLGVAAGLAKLPKRLVPWALGALCGLLAVTTLRVWTERHNGLYREAAAAITASGEPHPLLVHEDVLTLLPLWYLLPNAEHVMLIKPTDPWSDWGQRILWPRRVSEATDAAQALSAGRPVWLCDQSFGYIPIDAPALARLARWQQAAPPTRLSPPHAVFPMTLWHLTPKP